MKNRLNSEYYKLNDLHLQLDQNKTQICPVCKHISLFIFDSLILNKYKVGYYYCRNCSTIATEKQYLLDKSMNASNDYFNKLFCGLKSKTIDNIYYISSIKLK